MTESPNQVEKVRQISKLRMGVTRTMLLNEHENPELNRDFVLWKIQKHFIEPLNLDKAEFDTLMVDAWGYYSSEYERNIQLEIESLANKVKANPELKKELLAKLK